MTIPTVESEWEDFREAVLPPGPADQIALFRDIFRAGAIAVLNLRSQGVSEAALLAELAGREVR